MLALIATICQYRQAAPTLTHIIVKADIADLAARWSQLQAEAVQDNNDRGTWRLTTLPTCMLGQIQIPPPTDLPIVTAMEAVVPEPEAPFQAEVPQGITMP